MTWLGLDIGGANLKAADGCGWARSVPFSLWRSPAGLVDALEDLIASAPAANRIAVTMTGELCDCFRTKAEGVRHILATVENTAGQRSIRVYLVDGRFVSPADACERPELAAASNWHAVACLAGRFTQGRAGLLIDVGSTTTDIIPLVDGQPHTTALTDTDRLIIGQLVYTGVGRTPLCAVTSVLPWRGQDCPVAAELFATTADVYVLLGNLPEQLDIAPSADGRPLTRQFAIERIARMICADTTTFDAADAQQAAESMRRTQIAQLKAAVRCVTTSMPVPPVMCVLSGSGEFLAEHLTPAMPRVSLKAELGVNVSHAAAAHAVAVLAQKSG